jgi:ArsR family transcriptional regulator
VSKHLSLLKGAGIVLDDKRGVQVFYRLRVPCILNFFGCVEAVLEELERESASRIAAS